MTLDEYKKSLESEARIENEELKKKLEKQEIMIDQLNIYLEKQKSLNSLLIKDLNCLTNRCRVFTQGTICLFCNFESDFRCKYK